ncbi:MAG: beta-lactamase family protein [Firmicutes bacterium]|nr:beta-lactamase family protein [Bacillota bacterium]
MEYMHIDRNIEGKVQALSDQIGELCLGFIERGYFPSCTVRVFDAERTLYAGAFGANYLPKTSGAGSGKTPVNIDTAYDMASCTKIATATQILLMMEEGKLSLETGLVEALDEIKDYPHLYERTKDVTLYQLLTHTSGILDWYPFYVQRGKDFYQVFDSFIGDTPIMDHMVYSDMNFMLLGKVLEKMKGKNLKGCQEDLKQLLGARRMDYQPESLENTAPSCYGNDIEEHMVAERGLIFRGWRSKNRPTIGVNDGNAHYYFDDAAGHAGIIADAESYEKLCRLYMTSEGLMLKRSMDRAEENRGLGWQLDEKMYPGGCGHTGFSGSWIWIDREDGIGAVALTNRLAFPVRHATNTNEFRRSLAGLIYQAIH